MDPISQGAIGAAFAQTRADQERLGSIALFGALAGMAPDLDVFIQSSTDPLLFLEFHRHFTHALVFIPFGALIVAAVLFRILRHSLTFREAYMACLLGYATHGLLDACTSYGTQLFWPFSNYRVAWNNVSVVDPLFTLPLVTCVVMAIRRHRVFFAYCGVAWALAYLLFGWVQHERVVDAAKQIASVQQHTPARLTIKPSFANLLLWKIIYEDSGSYHIHGVRAGLEMSWCPGESVTVLDVARDFPNLNDSSQQRTDIERFRWFSQDYLALGREAGLIIDVRYSALPHRAEPMWGIGIEPEADDQSHATWYTNRNISTADRQAFIGLFRGVGCEPIIATD